MLIRFWCVAFTVLLIFSGCRSSKTIATDNAFSTEESSDLNYRLIYIIHGDANYLYHDTAGRSLQSDEQQHLKDVEVAEKAKHGEVFIYHQRPETKILWLFPRKDRRMLHYRKGKRIHHKKYSPVSETKAFLGESRLYHKYRSRDSLPTFFLYFGHEIPKDSTASYFQSRPDAQLTTDSFVEGERSFLENSSYFELSVLSTCDNGTPEMAAKQQPLTKYLLASPQNLHLSQIDSRKLLLLEEDPDISTKELTEAIARDSFDRLSSFLQTAVTLSIYDMSGIGSYIDSLSADYNRAMEEASRGAIEQDNIDCAVSQLWDAGQQSEGIITLFK